MFPSPLILLLLILLVPVAVVQAIKWLIAPILVRRRHKVAAHPAWEQTRDEQLTPEMRDFIGTVVGQFSAEGFHVVSNLHQPNAVANVRAVQVLLVNRATGDQAAVVATLGRSHRTLAFAVRSVFSDGSRVTTGNNPSPGIYPPHPTDQPIKANWLHDARALYELHRRRLAAMGRGRELRIAPAPGTELEHVQREWPASSNIIGKSATSGSIAPANTSGSPGRARS